MQAFALVLFIVPFTFSFFVNGCFEADMDNRWRLFETLLLTPCFSHACSFLTFARPFLPDTTSTEGQWAVSDAIAALQNCIAELR
jgi:hypothetical protein